jgi:2-C-methyl-D-erythritol 4-phosphate cytidylyltransferase
MTQPVPPRFFALVPCAGIGERAGTDGPKQYAVLAGQSVVSHTLAALAHVSRLHEVLVVLSPSDGAFARHAAAFGGRVATVGGTTRAQSVLNGLGELKRWGAADTDWVLVHDAARCLVRPEWIDALIDACADDPVGGLLALPVADTLKEASGERVSGTVSRAGKWQAQTPQMFRLGPLHDALTQAGSGVTDEASAMEALGHAPRLVHGSLENFKVTFPPDFELAERLLRTRA